MKSKQIDARGPERTYALIFETGDEVIERLEWFAREMDLTGSHFTAIGAFSDAVLAYFDWNTRQYKDIPVNEQVEVLVMAGDIALKDDQPAVHAHVVLGRSDGSTRGGHLKRAHVRPTLELILSESPADLRKRVDRESGLALIAL